MIPHRSSSEIMKKLPILSGLTLLAVPICLLLAQPDVESSIKQAELGWSSAILKNDLTQLDRILSDDLVYYHSSGLVDTKRTYLSNLQSAKFQYHFVDYEQMKIRAFGNTSVVNAKLRIKAIDNGTPIDNLFLLTHVFVKQRGSWQLVSHQTTRLP